MKKSIQHVFLSACFHCFELHYSIYYKVCPRASLDVFCQLYIRFYVLILSNSIGKSNMKINVIKRLLEGWEPADAGLCIKASYNKRGNQGGALVHVESIIRSAGNIGCDIPRLLTIAPVLPNLWRLKGVIYLKFGTKTKIIPNWNFVHIANIA